MISNLGGWWRLWLIGTLVLLTYNIKEALDYQDIIDQMSPPTACVPFTIIQNENKYVVGYKAPIKSKIIPIIKYKADPLDRLRQKLDELDDADRRAKADPDYVIKTNPYYVMMEKELTEPQPIFKKKNSYSCVSAYRLGGYVLWVIALCVAAILFGFTARWVYSGFAKGRS